VTTLHAGLCLKGRERLKFVKYWVSTLPAPTHEVLQGPDEVGTAKKNSLYGWETEAQKGPEAL
jgi:hypothetical protein